MTEADTQRVQAIRSLLAVGNLSEASHLCEERLRGAAEGPEACLFQALLLTTTGHLNDAVAQYEEALALAPEALPAYMGIADILASKGWISSAAIVMENAQKSVAFTDEAQKQFDALKARFAQAKCAAGESSP
jgi:hypothetical protein